KQSTPQRNDSLEVSINSIRWRILKENSDSVVGIGTVGFNQFDSVANTERMARGRFCHSSNCVSINSIRWRILKVPCSSLMRSCLARFNQFDSVANTESVGTGHYDLRQQ